MKELVQVKIHSKKNLNMCIDRKAEMNLQIYIFTKNIVSYKMMEYVLWDCLFHRVEINCIPHR